MSMKRAFFLVGAGILMLASQCLGQGRVGYVDIDKVTRKAPQVTKVMSEVQGRTSRVSRTISRAETAEADPRPRSGNRGVRTVCWRRMKSTSAARNSTN